MKASDGDEIVCHDAPQKMIVNQNDSPLCHLICVQFKFRDYIEVIVVLPNVYSNSIAANLLLIGNLFYRMRVLCLGSRV